MTDTPTAVENGVSAYARVEDSLQDAHDALLDLPATYSALRANGVIGYLEASERSTAALALAGQVATALNAVFVNHQKDTARAQALNIDLPAPPAVTAAALAAGTPQPLGGGR